MSLRVNLVVLWFALSAVQGAAGSPSKIAITHVTVIDVRAGTIAQDMTVLIVGDRISAVRAAKEKERLPTKEIEVIDGRGKYLIPGLWDMHAHSDGDDRALHLLIAYGITGIRDMAGDAAKLADARRRITSRELTGPRLVFSGPMLEGPPSQADDWTWIIHSPEEARNAIDRLVELRVDFIKVHDGLARESFLAIAAASKERGISFVGPEEARNAVNRLVELRVDFIKVHDGLARESFLAIAAASKERGISFVGHVPASMTPAEASDLGQKSIEHLEFVPKSCHALFELPAAAPRHVPSGCDRNHFTSCFIGSRTMVPGSTPLFRVSDAVECDLFGIS